MGKNITGKTKLRAALFVWSFLFISLFSLTLHGAPMYPKAESTYLNDFARMVNEKDATEIKNALFNFRINFHFPVVLVTVEDLGGEEVQIFATELANQWGIGEKGKSNGTLILFSREDRKVTLQLGRDIRDSIPTSDRERIIKNMVSYFKNGDYSTGLKEGTRMTLDHLKKWVEKGQNYSKKAPSGIWNETLLTLFGFFCYICVTIFNKMYPAASDSGNSSWDTSSNSSWSDSGGADWGGGSFDGDGSSGSW